MDPLKLDQVVEILSNDDNRSKSTICTLMDDGLTVEDATQVYLFPKCIQFTNNAYYGVGWCPAKNKFISLCLNNDLDDLIFVKTTTAYSEKQTFAEQFLERLGREQLMIDDAITTICSNRDQVFDARTSMKVNGALTQVLTAITRSMIILPVAYTILEDAITKLVAANMEEANNLSCLLAMICDYKRKTDRYNELVQVKTTINRFHKTLLIQKKAAAEKRDEQEFVNTSSEQVPSDLTRVLFDTVKKKIAALSLMLSNFRYVTTAEVYYLATTHFLHLAPDNLPQLVSGGLEQLLALNYVEYTACIDTYTLTEAGRAFALETMAAENKLINQ